jgi:hypothetical protein
MVLTWAPRATIIIIVARGAQANTTRSCCVRLLVQVSNIVLYLCWSRRLDNLRNNGTRRHLHLHLAGRERAELRDVLADVEYLHWDVMSHVRLSGGVVWSRGRGIMSPTASGQSGEVLVPSQSGWDPVRKLQEGLGRGLVRDLPETMGWCCDANLIVVLTFLRALRPPIKETSNHDQFR